MARAIRTFARLFLGASSLSRVLGLALQNPVPPSFMQMMTKHCGVLASPAQADREDTTLPGSRWPHCPSQPWYNPSGLGVGRAAAGPGMSGKSCPTVQQRTEGSSLFLPSRLYRLFSSLCDPTGVTLTCRASQTCSTLSVSLMNLTQSCKTDRERVGRVGDTTLPPPHTTLSIP